MILWLLKLGITMVILNKNYIEFVTEFPCLLGHIDVNYYFVKILLFEGVLFMIQSS